MNKCAKNVFVPQISQNVLLFGAILECAALSGYWKQPCTSKKMVYYIIHVEFNVLFNSCALFIPQHCDDEPKIETDTEIWAMDVDKEWKKSRFTEFESIGEHINVTLNKKRKFATVLEITDANVDETRPRSHQQARQLN